MKKKRGISVETAKQIRADKGIEETKLQRLRVERGLTQAELAEKSGVSRRAIQCYEQQTRRIDGASLESLCDLSLTLNCSIQDILESEELIKKLNETI